MTTCWHWLTFAVWLDAPRFPQRSKDDPLLDLRVTISQWVEYVRRRRSKSLNIAGRLTPLAECRVAADWLEQWCENHLKGRLPTHQRWLALSPPSTWVP